MKQQKSKTPFIVVMLFIFLPMIIAPMAFGQDFIDNFNRPNNAALGNGWVEKTAAAFALTGNAVSKAATGTGFADNLVYRPTNEAMLDGEASVEVRFANMPPGYAQMFVRGQPGTIAQAGQFNGYLLFTDNSATRVLLDRIENGNFIQLAQLTLNPGLNTTDTFRLRLRATGTNPVLLEAFVERLVSGAWQVIGQATFNDTAATRFTTPGTVGFTGYVEGGIYVFDNFTRTNLGGGTSTPAPMVSGVAPNSTTAGGPAFTLTVQGDNFTTDSVVRWNGADRPTSFISATQLQATIAAADIVATGTAAVTVFTPAPGGGMSNPGSVFILEPGSAFFLDDFNRANNATIGNAWTEKFPAAFSIQNNEIVNIDTAPIDYHDAIVYRPMTEDRRDIEVGLEFRILPGMNFPQVHARVQRDTLNQPDTLEAYLLFVDGFEPSPGRAIIAIQQPVTNQFECYMRAIPFPSPLQQSERYRLRFRILGANPVTLTGIVERFDGAMWREFASGTTIHDGTTQRDPALYCDPGFMPPPIPDAGAVGFAKWTTNNEVLDNFFWIDRSGADPAPVITGVSPTTATAGGPALTLTVQGSNFTLDSDVRWNGANRPTTFISSTELQAAIAAADIAVEGTAQVTVFTPPPGGGTSNAQPFTIAASGPPTTITVTFDNPVPPGGSGDLLTGIFVGIDFGTSQWRWEGAYAPNPTNHIFFASAAGTARTLRFTPGPRLLESLRVFTGAAGTLTLSDDQGQLVNRALSPGGLQVIQTGWTQGLTTVTVNFTAGWNLGVDDLVYRSVSGGASNPIPTTSGLVPSSALEGGAGLTLTVMGSGFVEDSVVRWNGAERPTILVSATELQVAIGSADIAEAGTVQVTVFTPAPGGGTSNAQVFVITSDNPSTEVVVDFDDPEPPGGSGDLLAGVFEGINFGTGQWRWEGAYGPNPTNHIFFASAAGTSRTFQFAAGPRLLESIQVFAGAAGTLTLSDDQGQTVSRNLTPGPLQLVQTGWALESTTVTVNFTAGWDLGIDDIVYRE